MNPNLVQTALNNVHPTKNMMNMKKLMAVSLLDTDTLKLALSQGLLDTPFTPNKALNIFKEQEAKWYLVHQ
jgi:hypothetical protein